MRAYDNFACSHDVWACLSLQFVGDEEQQKAALQEVDTKKEWHEAQIRIILQYLIQSFGG